MHCRVEVPQTHRQIAMVDLGDRGRDQMSIRRWMVALGLLCAPLVHAQPVGFADLARHMQYDTVKISPDGKYLAATAVVQGHPVLALLRLADNKGQLVRPNEADSVTDFWWAPATRVVYEAGTRKCWISSARASVPG